MTGRVVTANRLIDGAVVYLAGDGGWSERIDDSLVADTEGDIARIQDMAAEAERAPYVVGAYLIDVAVEGGAVRPLRLRETIRAQGPTERRRNGPDAAANGDGSRVPVR